MSKVIPLFSQPQERPTEPIPRKAGNTLLEYMQQTRGLPYYAPTVQFRSLREGCGLYKPVNPLARLFGKLLGRQVLNEAQLLVIEEMGMVVERRPE